VKGKLQSEQRPATGIKRLETRVGRIWGFQREEKGGVAKLSPEGTARRLTRLFIASIDSVASFLRERMGESFLQSMFEYESEKFGEGLEKYPWRADEIAKNMIRLNFQPFGIEATYTGDAEKATIVVSRCPMPERFLESVEFLEELTFEQPLAIKGDEMFASQDRAERSLDWPPRKTEVCATCRIVMPKLGRKLGFNWNHTAIKDVPPRCVFDIEITKHQK
jgi:hypothetical protein